MNTKGIALALGGFGAGLSGQLPQFQQVQNQRMQLEQQQQQQNQISATERHKTLFEDAKAALDLASRGNWAGVILLGQERLKLLQHFPDANPEDTQRILQLAAAARNGSEEAATLAMEELSSTVEVGEAMGILPQAAPQRISSSEIADGFVVEQNPDGSYTRQRVIPEDQGDRKIDTDARGVRRYVDTGEPVFPGIEKEPEGIGSADESLMFRQAVELLGGIFDQAGRIQALDPNLRPKAQAIATEAAKLLSTRQAKTRSEAVMLAAEAMGVDFNRGAGGSQDDPLGIRGR